MHSSRYPSPSIISVTQAIFALLSRIFACQQHPDPTQNFLKFPLLFKRNQSIHHTHSCKILHHVTFGAMAMIATRSFITYVQNNGADSQKNIITYTQNNGNNSRKISSCTYRTMGMIAANFHHVHSEQWQQQPQIFIMCRVKLGFTEIREPVARAEGAPKFW